MAYSTVEVSVKGRAVRLPAISALGHTVITTGRWLKLAEIFDEAWRPEDVTDPESLVREVRSQNLKADILTFTQKLPGTTPRFQYPFEWDNVAAVSTTSYKDWWENRLPQVTRKNVRRSAKRNVTVRAVNFDDNLARGIKAIYDETPVRQGRRFWHYGKDIETIRRENSSYLDRAEFVGAFYEEQLIGFIKMVYVGKVSNIMQIISMNIHEDKRPTNALIAKAVEICAEKGMSYFVYGQYVYGNNTDSQVVEFKRRNGFEQILVPKYFVPLTPRGRLAVKLKLHLGVRRLLPRKMERTLLQMRAKLYHWLSTKGSGAEHEAETESTTA